MTEDPAVIELRQYVLRPGQRETLVDIFDRELVESQEATGMRIIGQFRDLDRPDRFVWLRGFPDMATRCAALTDFYSGPVWKAHGRAAAATMVDSDDVLLLRPTGPLHLSAAGPRGLIAVTVFPLPGPDDAPLLTFLRDQVDPILPPGRSPVAELRTEPAANTYPDLPVREGEYVVVRIDAFTSEAAHTAHRTALRADPRWHETLRPALHSHLTAEPQRLRLTPTPRSRLR